MSFTDVRQSNSEQHQFPFIDNGWNFQEETISVMNWLGKVEDEYRDRKDEFTCTLGFLNYRLFEASQVEATTSA